MKVNIITDGASDITDAEAKRLGIIKINTAVSFKGSGALPEEDFWQSLKDGKVAVTSQVTPAEFSSAFEKIESSGEGAVCVTISSEMSSTYKNALFVKENEGFKNVEVIDSLMASFAEGALVKEACSLRDKGLSAKEIAENLERIKKKIKLFACMDTLKYAARGGRVSPSAAAIGAIMNIKPIITFSDEGKIKVVSRPRGKKKGADRIAEIIEGEGIDFSRPVSVIYSDDENNSVGLYEKLSAKKIPLSGRFAIGSAIGAHIGPGAFGAVIFKK